MINLTIFPGKGRGIVATKNIQKGTLIEAVPASRISHSERNVIEKLDCYRYLFVNPTEYVYESAKVSGYIVFGMTSLCNHSDSPNACVNWIEDDCGIWAHLEATEEIREGEEVTIFYTNIDEYLDAASFS
ncbi:MAG: SET domain-containing protein-lysine N-methyltransferase [Cyanobacteria bacterium P01_F01_bin.150]